MKKRSLYYRHAIILIAPLIHIPWLPMRAPKILFSLTAALLIIGAGCENAPTNNNTNSGTLILPGDAAAADTNALNTTPAAADIKMDGAWKTYSNSAFGFSFKWPSVGRYAPRWNVSFAKENDTRIKDGCLVVANGQTETVSVADVPFCHTSVDLKDGASAADYYVTKKSGQHVILAFTKSKDAGKDFSWSDYRAGLAQIVATYSAGK